MRFRAWALPIVTLIVGLGVGTAVGASPVLSPGGYALGPGTYTFTVPSPTPTPTPTTTSTPTPTGQVGVYAGSANTAAMLSVDAQLKLAPTQVTVSDYFDNTDASKLTGTYPLSAWKAAMPAGTHYVFGVSPIFSGHAGSFGAPGGTAGNAATQYANLMAGGIDPQLKTCFANIAALDPHAAIRIEWEQNGYGNVFSLNYFTAAQIVAIYQHVAVLVHAAGLRTVFDPVEIVGSQGSIVSLYPGDSYVDLIGPDVYAQQWLNAGMANPTEPAEWNALLTQGGAYNPSNPNGSYKFGLEWYAGFAAAHGKPLLLSEVGLWPQTTTIPGEGGTGDDAYFVQQYALWATANNAETILWADQRSSAALFTSGTPLATAQAITSFGR